VQTTIENKGEAISDKSIELQDKEDTFIQYNPLDKSSRVAFHRNPYKQKEKTREKY
jgi:hypothetical protein